MLTSGEIVVADLGEPVVVVTAQVVLVQDPSVVHVVPVTSTRRGFRSEIELDPDLGNGLDEPSAAQCQHVRAVSTGRLGDTLGHVGPAALVQIRETIADLLDL